MPYALFDDDQKLSEDYLTEDEAWEHAEEAGLIDVVNGRKVLEDGYTIQPCVTDEDSGAAIAMPRAVT
jgi:hypothetical protein